jgi:hypothetical protein
MALSDTRLGIAGLSEQAPGVAASRSGLDGFEYVS